MAKLDHRIPKLMDVVSSRGEATGVRIRQIKDMLLKHNTIEVRREVAFHCLVVNVGEKEEDLFKEFGDTEEFEAGIDGQVMEIAIISDQSTPGSDHKTATIVAE
ncbi:hypothetical protein ILYODFUR_029481 [Ilyodon furcidens]|uniref:Uncharacterized protein n=1 Tax=Ilyodon furcidens TaxID=33524 RepID=A0ABV0TDE5_9TELE